MTYEVKTNLCAGQEDFVSILESLIRKFDLPQLIVTCGEDTEVGLPEYRITRVVDAKIIASIILVKNGSWSWEVSAYGQPAPRKCKTPSEVTQVIGNSLSRLVTESIR